jgi:hypothetical protein
VYDETYMIIFYPENSPVRIEKIIEKCYLKHKNGTVRKRKGEFQI